MVALTFGLKGIQDKLQRHSDAFNKEAFRISGEETIREIRDNSAKGVDFNGNSLRAYTPRYAIAKRKRVGSSTPVNLRLSGSMLDTLSEQNGVIFSHEDERAQYVSMLRRFMGVSQVASDKIILRLRGVWNAVT